MFLGIDLGTSEAKVLLLDEAGRVAGSAAEGLAVQRPRPLWSEQDPQAWWQAVDAAARRLAGEHPSAIDWTAGIAGSRGCMAR